MSELDFISKEDFAEIMEHQIHAECVWGPMDGQRVVVQHKSFSLHGNAQCKGPSEKESGSYSLMDDRKYYWVSREVYEDKEEEQ